MEGNWQFCDENMQAELFGPREPCPYSVVYNSPDGKRVKDRPSSITLDMHVGLQGLFIALAALGLLLAIAITLYLAYHHQSNLVKASQVQG